MPKFELAAPRLLVLVLATSPALLCIFAPVKTAAGIACLLIFLKISAELVVFLAVFRVAEHLIRLADLLKFFFRGLIARVYIRMVFAGQFPVRFLDLVGSGRLAHLQAFIIILVVQCYKI